MGNCLCQPSASPSSVIPPPSVPAPSVPAPSVPAPSVPAPSVPAPSVPTPSVPSSPSLDLDEKTRERVPSISDVYQGITYENTPEYTLEGLRRKVKVLRIIDGDTVDIALHHEETGRIYRHRVRLYGIDTPEKRPSRSDPHRDLEIAASFRAKQALEQRVLENDYIVLAVFYSPDKYGRLLCSFYDKHGENLNEWMVKKGYATEYFGKTKKMFQAVAFSPEVSI